MGMERLRQGVDSLQAAVAALKQGPLPAQLAQLEYLHSLTAIAAAQSVQDTTLTVSVPNYTPGQAIPCHMTALDARVLFAETGLDLKSPYRCIFDPAYQPLFVVGNRFSESGATYEVSSPAGMTQSNVIFDLCDYGEAILERLFWS